MKAWTPDELARIGRAEELELLVPGVDGSPGRPVPIWVVRAGDELFVRSARGPENGWYRRARASGEGRIRAGGVERDISFEDPGASLDAAVDLAYHRKYDRHGPAIVGSVVSAVARRTTLRLVPR